ncbi:alpha-tocopherol transfer protein-like [Mercenaria mercenaria]|uniref:alpha-tocopherol transfer protein-like n=1 Tax=Mercenaria mercenaria TaxID=6596 RepID=UPI00234ECDBE|nr:alpha-tocopherol transfer protein-like [Mercenaria mercenaria]
MASEEDDIKFVSKLDEESKKKAKRELNELNDTDRILAVQSFRQWILQQKWLKTPTDFSFLLKFLRARKFSQLEARKTLENYWTCKTKTPDWFRNVDPSEPAIQEILKTGFYIIPKQLDKYGRRVVIEKLARLDLNDVKKKWGVANLYRVIALVCDWAMRDENVQVNGLVVFVDNTDITMNHMLTLFGQENGKRLMQFWQNSMPARVKGLHLYNEPIFYDAMYALISPLMKQKLKDRMFLHGNSLTKVYDEIGMSALPDEYLPDGYEGPRVGTQESIVDEMIEDMMSPEFREYIKDLSCEKYRVDLKERKEDDTPTESFRKLNVE